MTTERITYRPQSTDGTSLRARTIILDNIVDGEFLGHPVIKGDEVDNEGVKVGRFHVLMTELIVKRVAVRMDLHYGIYVAASPSVPSSEGEQE